LGRIESSRAPLIKPLNAGLVKRSVSKEGGALTGSTVKKKQS